MEIQPCTLLGDVQNSRNSKKNGPKSHTSKILLFTGDAKENKGFLSLPEIAKSMLEQLTICGTMATGNDKAQNAWTKVRCQGGIEIIVQYTITNDSPELALVDKQLQQLAESDSRLVIIKGFLSHQKLIELFNSTRWIIFNYDEEVYKMQSSGVLWMAAFFDLRVLFLTQTWLSREAQRLDVDSYQVSQNEIIERILIEELDMNSSNFVKQKSCYYRQLFQDIGQWLIDISQPNDKQNFEKPR